MERTSQREFLTGWSSLKRNIRHNRLVVAFLSVFLLSLFYGSFLMSHGNEPLQNILSFLTREYISGREEQSLLTTFLTVLSSSILYLAFGFLLGFFAFGQPVDFFIIFFRGFGLGLAMGNIYMNHHFSGVLYCLVLIVPAAVLFTIVLICALRDSLKLSNLFLSSAFPRLGAGVSAEILKAYCVKYIFYFILVLGVCGADTLLNFIFSPMLGLNQL